MLVLCHRAAKHTTRPLLYTLAHKYPWLASFAVIDRGEREYTVMLPQKAWPILLSWTLCQGWLWQINVLRQIILDFYGTKHYKTINSGMKKWGWGWFLYYFLCSLWGKIVPGECNLWCKGCEWGGLSALSFFFLQKAFGHKGQMREP